MRTNDGVAGAILITLAIGLIALTLNFPPFPGQKYGPSLFPRLLAGGLMICGLLLMIRHASSSQRAPALTLAAWTREPWRLASFVLVLLAVLAAVLLWDRVGFVPISVVTLAVLFLWFRVRPTTAIATAVLATVLLQMFFGKGMRVPLPLGWLLQLPPGWLKYLT